MYLELLEPENDDFKDNDRDCLRGLSGKIDSVHECLISQLGKASRGKMVGG